MNDWKVNLAWNRYLGPHVTPKQYAADGGNEQTLIHNLTELWGDPRQGDDYIPPKKVRELARKLAQQLPH